MAEHRVSPCAGDELEELTPVLILMKMKGLGCLPPNNLWNMKGLGVFSFPILLKTKGDFHHVDGRNLSNTDDFEFCRNVLCKQVFLFTLSRNFHQLGWYIAKANSWCFNLATLSLYYFLGVIEPIRPRFNDIPQRCWLAEMITRLLHQLVRIWAKPITCVHPWPATFFLEQTFRTSNKTKERRCSHLAVACFV